MNDIKLCVTGGIWAVAPVSEQPQIQLRDWMILEIEPAGTRHFVGHNIGWGEGRVSTAIEQFDPATGKGVTNAGRIYQLIGPPGRDSDGLYVWERWSRINGVTACKDVSDEIWKEMSRSPAETS